MADKSPKTMGPTQGPYYIDQNCIACGACLVDASEFIAMNEEDAYAYFFKQPENEQDRLKCEEALIACPVESIKNDG